MTALNPKTTALVMIDLQHGITALPLAPHGSAQVVDQARTLARQLRSQGGTVIWVTVGWSGDFGDALRQPVDKPLAARQELPANWSDLVDGLSEPGDLHVRKRQWGAFHGTDLDLQLRRRGIDTVVLGGIATNFGVESTARQTWELGYQLIVVEDACSSIDTQLHGMSIEHILPRIGQVRSTHDVLAALEH
ncbi:hydrolase [Frateuria aurantia]